MWVLLLIFLKSDGAVIAYDQGRYESWEECVGMGHPMVEELGDKYIFTCVDTTKRGN